MKILYVTTIGGTMRFFKQLIKELVEDGHTVDIAANTITSDVPEEYKELGCRVFPISCTRSPFNKGSLIAIRQLKRIVSSGQYDLVHCHTPIAAMCTRVACRKFRKNGMRVFYTAHGFHFYQGAPLINWLLYYPIEKFCSFFTDVLITINKEDYALARNKMKAKRIEYVPGVGIDVAKFADTVVDRDVKRDELGVPRDAFMLLSIGDLNTNKNHEIVIKALSEINDSTIHYVIAGKGRKKDYLEKIADEKNVNLHLIGFRKDITEIDKTADVFIFPSLREGLSVSVMEVMASGLPIICSSIRGNTDLVNENGGFLFDPTSVDECAEAIRRIRSSNLVSIGKYNSDSANKYKVEAINARMKEIYRQ